jgi:hypothetical protein
MLPAERYRALDPAEVGACAWCGARPRGSNEQNPALQFVAVDITGDDEVVPAGLTMTVDNQPARRVTVAKDGFGRGTFAVTQEHVTVCAECVQRVAELVGFGDTLPLQAEAEQLRAELAATRERLQEALDRAEEADEALKATAAISRLLDASKPPTKPAAKKPPTKPAAEAKPPAEAKAAA